MNSTTRRALWVLLLLTTSLESYTQAPSAFKYQGIARNAEGATYKSESIQLQFALLEEDGSGNPPSIYEEQHTVLTSPQGVFSVTIGEGMPLLGAFTAADWTHKQYTLQIKFRPGTDDDFVDLGKTRLLSVPYALHANTVTNKDDADADPGNELQQLSLTGSKLDLSQGGGSIELGQIGSSPWLVSTPDPELGIYYPQNVGIHNTNPGEDLSIGNNFKDSPWDFPALTIGGAGAEGAAIELGNDEKKLRIYTTQNTENSIETVENSIPGNGVLNILARQVNIGSSGAPRKQDYPLAVQANVNDGHCLLLESAFNDHRWEFYPNSATNQLFVLYNGDAIGYWNPSTGIYTAGVSDERRKENITSLQEVSSRYRDLSVYQYNYKSSPDERYTGFIAQQLQHIFPGAVSTVKMDGQAEAVLIVDYDQVTAINTAAIQEQQAYIEQLENKLAEQEKRLANIEALLNKN